MKLVPTAQPRSNVVFVGFVVLALLILFVYVPVQKIGFRFVDDYTYLYWAGTLPLPQYLAHAFDPQVQSINYRPLKRTLILIEYYIFRGDPNAYHLVQNLIHVLNSLSVGGIVWQFAKRWRLAFLAALFFATLPIACEAVFWISDETPLATFFSLGALFFWIRYLQTPRKIFFVFALGAFAFALLSKEATVIVPILFFLIDRLLIRSPAQPIQLLRRYGLIIILLVGYLILQFRIQQQGTFTHEGGYFIGAHILSNYLAYLAMLVFPWGSQRYALADMLFGWVGLLFIVLALIKRKVALLCLVLCAILAIGPVVLASLGPGPRYLYLATGALAILWALGVELVWTRWKSVPLLIMLSMALAGLMAMNSLQIASAAAELAETSRQQRVPFRDIMRQHPTFPPNTRLFLIEPPYNLSMMDIAGMFFLRYGTSVSVSGTFADGRLYTGGRLRVERAHFADYSMALVYYFDETNRPIEIPVQSNIMTRAVPTLPQKFQIPIRLEGYELTGTTIQRGKPLALILYWLAMGNIDKDYTVFVHLIDANGQIIAGDDSYPRGGKEQTSTWRAGRFTADAHVLSIPHDAPIGNDYRLEVGLYYLPTMQRVMITNGDGVPITDHIQIESFEVTE